MQHIDSIYFIYLTFFRVEFDWISIPTYPSYISPSFQLLCCRALAPQNLYLVLCTLPCPLFLYCGTAHNT